MTNKILENEFNFIHYFNNKKFNQLSEKWKKHLKRIFPSINNDSVIYCSKHENYSAKGDIDLRIKGDKKIISLKNGKNPTMHKERFTWLYHDLKNLGLSSQTLNVLTLYQFGECKSYGHIEKPLSREEIILKYSPLIKKANEELNREEVLDMIIERSIVKGRKEYRQSIDYLYYGNLEKGILISTDQIYKSIKSRKSLSSNWIHFGQLVFQPAARSREKNNYLDSAIHWPVLGKLFYVAKDEDNILDCTIDS